MAVHSAATGVGGDAHPTPPVSDEERALFGEFLVSARRQSGLSLDEIFFRTKVPPRYLEALEQGRVELLPGGLYRRSILKDYAAAIGLDPAIALERFTRIFGPQAVLTEWQGIPHIPSPPSATEALRQTLALAPVTGVRQASFRVLAISAQALPPMPKIPRAFRHLALAAGITIVVAFTARLILVASRTDRPNGAPPPAADLQPGETGRAIAITAPVASAINGGQPITSGVRAGDVTLAPEYADTRPAQPDVQPSRLVITSRPAGARVTVNGIGWGVTPITIRHLPPGDKVVRLTKDGYVGQERQVRVGEDGGAYSVGLTLRPRN